MDTVIGPQQCYMHIQTPLKGTVSRNKTKFVTIHSAQYSPWQTLSTLQRLLSTVWVRSLVLPLIECTVCTWYTVSWCVTVVILATFMICFTLQKG
jgi:hypothetical protein